MRLGVFTRDKILFFRQFRQTGKSPNEAAAQSSVSAIAAGVNHSLALKADGTTIAWGWNGFGQCNVPNRSNVSTLFLLLGN